MKLEPGNTAVGDVLIYEYGVRISDASLSAVVDQITRSRFLYNELVSRIRAIVLEMNAFVLDSAGEPAHLLHAQIEMLNADFDAARTRNDESAMRKIAEDRRIKRHELAIAVADTRKRLRSELTSRFFSRIGKNSGCETYQLRSEAVANGLGWGTANAVLDAALQAFKKSIQQGKPPRFSVGADKTQDTLTPSSAV